MNDELVYIYFDRNQCDRWDLSYFGEGTLTAGAHVILESKHTGYDKYHQTVLQQFGGRAITLTKTEADRPGWYLLVGYTKKDFPGLQDGNA